MPRPATLPRWATNPGVGFPGAVAPNSDKKDNGWANREEPPAGEFNWLVQHHADWIAYIDQELIPAKEIANALARWRKVQPGSGTAVLSAAAVMYRELTTNPTGIVPKTQQHVIAVGADGANAYAIGSLDGGHTWVTPSSPPVGGFSKCVVAPAFHVADTFICGVGVGAGGVYGIWPIGAVSSIGTGTMPAAPATVSDLFYDHVNNYLWAATSQGIYRGVITSSTAITWVQMNSLSNYTHVRVLDSGRVVAYRSTDDRLYYLDSPHSAVNAGVVVGSSGTIRGMESFGASGLLLLDSGRELFRSVDATAVNTTLTNYFPDAAGGYLRKFRGGLVMLDIDAQALWTLPAYADATAVASLVKSLIGIPIGGDRLQCNHGWAAAPSRTSNQFIWLSETLADIRGGITP